MDKNGLDEVETCQAPDLSTVKVQRLKRNVVVLGSSYEEPFGLPPPLKRYCLNSHVAGHRVIR